MWSIGHFRGQFHSAIDRTRGHNHDLWLAAAQSLLIHRIEQRVLVHRRKRPNRLAFKLNSEQIQHIAARKYFVQIIGHLNPELLPILRDQRCRSTDNDVSPEFQ